MTVCLKWPLNHHSEENETGPVLGWCMESNLSLSILEVSTGTEWLPSMLESDCCEDNGVQCMYTACKIHVEFFLYHQHVQGLGSKCVVIWFKGIIVIIVCDTQWFCNGIGFCLLMTVSYQNLLRLNWFCNDFILYLDILCHALGTQAHINLSYVTIKITSPCNSSFYSMHFMSLFMFDVCDFCALTMNLHKISSQDFIVQYPTDFKQKFYRYDISLWAMWKFCIHFANQQFWMMFNFFFSDKMFLELTSR